jgi:sporulation integral membrane protein YtvI
MERIKERLAELPEVKNFILFVLCGALIVFLTNNYFSVFAPFIIAYVVTQLLRPLMVTLKNKFKLPNAINTLICLLLFATFGGLICWTFGHYLVEGVKYLIGLLSSESTIGNIISFAQSLGAKFDKFAQWFNMEIDWNEVAKIVGDVVANLIKALSNFSINFAMKLPSFLIAFIIGCMAAFYMMCDYDKIASAAKKQMSPKTIKFFEVFNTQVLSSLLKMIMSYVLISVICFVELIIGFYVLGIKDAAFIALLIAILDVLPVLGSGGVLVPWGIVSLLMGDPLKGFGLMVLWGIIVIVRQIVEPKIVGSQIGLHPLLTIASLFVGLELMGGLGLIMAPLYIIVCKQLNDEGVIHLYKKAEISEKSEKINPRPKSVKEDNNDNKDA